MVPPPTTTVELSTVAGASGLDRSTSRLDRLSKIGYDVPMNNDKMLGKKGQPFCGSRCCGVGSKVKSHKRMIKRRERQAFRRDLSTM